MLVCIWTCGGLEGIEEIGSVWLGIERLRWFRIYGFEMDGWLGEENLVMVGGVSVYMMEIYVFFLYKSWFLVEILLFC